MRKRKRADWTQRVLLYRAYPRAIPQSLWDIAHKQQTLWNNLTSLWRAARDLGGVENAHAFAAAHFGLPVDEFKDNTKTIWKTFDEWARAALAQSGLDWVNGPDVLDRFQTGTRARRWPKFHGRLDRVALGHRFTGGGIDLKHVVDNARMTRFGLTSSATWQTPRQTHSPNQPHWRGRFQLPAGKTDSGDTLDFALALHRSLPEGAVLKRASWIGKRVGVTWFWYVGLTIEEAPVTPPAHATERRAGLDLGWRIIGDGTKHDYLRVGVLCDSEQRAVELRLPLWLRPERRAETRGLATVAQLQADADNALLAARQILGAESVPRGPRALRRLLDDMTAANLEVARGDHDDAVVADICGLVRAVNDLLALHDRALQRRLHLQHRLQERRRWYYQNLAKWLCQRYSVIAIEGDFALPQVHAKSDDPALQAAAKYRNYAAVGELRAFLRRAAKTYGTTIVEGVAAHTTDLCWRCGSPVRKGAEVRLVCVGDGAHEQDQDINAARNLLAQIDNTFGQRHDPNPFPGTWTRLDPPQSIQAVTIEIPAFER